MPDLNWIVPCRRAVVTGPIDYERLLNAWKEEMEDSEKRGKLIEWYQIESESYDLGIHSIEEFMHRFIHETEVPIPRWTGTASDDETTYVDQPFFDDYCVRLWKGPLRVLREAGHTLGPPDQNECKQVTHKNTEFLPGDVVEFALAFFLSTCRKSEYENVEFNPEGSFLLGTSLSNGSESQAHEIGIHDNLLGMKFQLLVDLAIGSFYHTGGVRGVGFNETVDGEQISSRGMIYGGSFGNPTRGRGDDWRIATNRWGHARGAPAPQLGIAPNLPALADINSSSWQGDDILTSAWACSPSTLFLSNYLFHNLNDYGDLGVQVMMERGGHPLAQRFASHTGGSTDRAAIDAADLSVLSKGDHEWALVKIYPSAKLISCTTKPIHGFLSAYHPLDGTGQATANAGELFFFEASARLGRWRRNTGGVGDLMYSAFGLRPFIWEAEASSSRDVFRTGLAAWYTSPGSDPARGIERDETLTQDLRPIWIVGTRRTPVRDYNSLYVDRAVPLPTLTEANGCFETKNTVLSEVRNAQHAVWRHANGQITGPAPNATYRSLLPALQP
jgi:hypothetical protein